MLWRSLPWLLFFGNYMAYVAPLLCRSFVATEPVSRVLALGVLDASSRFYYL